MEADQVRRAYVAPHKDAYTKMQHEAENERYVYLRPFEEEKEKHEAVAWDTFERNLQPHREKREHAKLDIREKTEKGKKEAYATFKAHKDEADAAYETAMRPHMDKPDEEWEPIMRRYSTERKEYMAPHKAAYEDTVQKFDHEYYQNLDKLDNEFYAVEDSFAKERRAYMAPHEAKFNKAYDESERKYNEKLDPTFQAYSNAQTEADSVYDATIKPYDEKLHKVRTLAKKHMEQAMVPHRQAHEATIARLGKEHGITPLSNYQEHLAISEISKKHSVGHWPSLGAPEFEFETSDMEHEGEKTLYVHEIQSDLHKKRPNSGSTLEKNWPEHAAHQIKTYARENGYKKVIVAPHSLQYKNNGGTMTVEDFRHHTEKLTPKQQSDVYEKDSEMKDHILGNTAGRIALKYRNEIMPALGKAFGAPAYQEMGVRGNRGEGSVSAHAFPIFRVDDTEKTED
jgi:hypothetical protein